MESHNKARAGKFSTWPMIMALLRERLDAEKPANKTAEGASSAEAVGKPTYEASPSLLKSLKNPRFQ